MSEESIIGILGALGCNSQRTGWTVRCPLTAHGKGRGDRDPSLSVSLGRKGIVMKCGAGCHTWAIVAHLGFELRDLFYEHKESPRPNLADLLARHHRGELQPLALLWDVTRDVTASPPTNVSSDIYVSSDNNVSCDIPGREGLGPTARAVFDDMALLWGLNAAVGETRPMPYSTRFCAARWPGATVRLPSSAQAAP